MGIGMMKRISYILLIALSIMACRPTGKSAGFTLTGTVPAGFTGKVYLQEYKNRKYIDLDSAEISEGRFIFTGILAEPAVYTITPSQKSKRIQLFLDNGPLDLEVTDDWEVALLKGSEEAEMFHRMLPVMAKGTASPDSLLLANPASSAALYFLNRNIYKYDYERLKLIRKQLSASLNSHSYMKELEENLARLENVLPGKVAPDFALPTVSGDTLSLSSLRGEYLLVDFWASWCPDCRKASPTLVELHERFKDKNLTIVGVSIDEERSRWLNAIEKDGLAWQQVISEGGWNSNELKAYAVRWLPTSYLIDPEGVIVAKSIEVSRLIPQIEALLN
jgi:peroxiredoxin